MTTTPSRGSVLLALADLQHTALTNYANAGGLTAEFWAGYLHTVQAAVQLITDFPDLDDPARHVIDTAETEAIRARTTATAVKAMAATATATATEDAAAAVQLRGVESASAAIRDAIHNITSVTDAPPDPR